LARKFGGKVIDGSVVDVVRDIGDGDQGNYLFNLEITKKQNYLGVPFPVLAGMVLHN
jgi:hypothetical protein